MCSSIIEFAVHQLKEMPIRCLQLHVVIQFAVCGMYHYEADILIPALGIHTRAVIEISCICLKLKISIYTCLRVMLGRKYFHIHKGF